MDVIFRKSFRVASYEVDPFGDVRPSAILHYLQETSGQHTNQWNLSVTDMFKRGLTWVMTRYRLQFMERPRIGSEIEVSTWMSGREGKFAYREFEVKTQDGAIVALGTASYALIDLKTRKPVVIADHLPEVPGDPRRVITEPMMGLPVIKTLTREVHLPVMLRDLDINGHVNHVVYVQWGLEAVPLEIWESYRPQGIEIEYRAETHYGDQVRVAVSVAYEGEEDEGREERGTPVLLHQVFHAETATELARLRTRWRKLLKPMRLARRQ
jgi:acyl-ACP thioesterase